MREINPVPSYQAAKRLMRLQKRAKRYGYRVARSRWHQPYVCNRGGLALFDSQDNVVAGSGYSLDLELAEKVVSNLISLHLDKVRCH